MRQNLKSVFWLVFALTLINYILMGAWTIPSLYGMTGQAIFDLRIFGYNLEEAHQLLTKLGEEGTFFYLNQQQQLDTTYPALLALCIGLAIAIFSPAAIGNWRFALALLPLPAMGVDYLENSRISRLLKIGPDNINTQDVTLASTSTVLKFQLYGVAGLVLALLLGIWVWKKFSLRKKTD